MKCLSYIEKKENLVKLSEINCSNETQIEDLNKILENINIELKKIEDKKISKDKFDLYFSKFESFDKDYYKKKLKFDCNDR